MSSITEYDYPFTMFVDGDGLMVNYQLDPAFSSDAVADHVVGSSAAFEFPQNPAKLAANVEISNFFNPNFNWPRDTKLQFNNNFDVILPGSIDEPSYAVHSTIKPQVAQHINPATD